MRGVFRDTHRLADAKYRIKGRRANINALITGVHPAGPYTAWPFAERCSQAAGDGASPTARTGVPAASPSRGTDGSRTQPRQRSTGHRDGAVTGATKVAPPPGCSRAPPSRWRRSRPRRPGPPRNRSRGIHDTHGGAHPRPGGSTPGGIYVYIYIYIYIYMQPWFNLNENRCFPQHKTMFKGF